MDIMGFFSTLIEPPSCSTVESAIDTLVDLNALDPETERLTPLGKHLTKLPMDAQLGKLLVYGALLGVGDVLKLFYFYLFFLFHFPH
jgi:HrpA-like RNA helicase